MTKPRNKMLEPPKNLLRPVVSDIHRRSFVFVDIYRSKSECIIKLINVRSFTKAFGICRHSPANVDIHYFRTLTVTDIQLRTKKVGQCFFANVNLLALSMVTMKIRCDQLKNKSSRRVTYGNPCYSIGSKANSIYFLNDLSVFIYLL
jgi:hypothetical protein